MHPTEGDLRAYTDGELSEAEQSWITAHLATCAGCQQQADELRHRAAWAESRLALLAPEQPPLPARAALARLASYPNQNKEARLMKTRPFARPYRPLWSGLAVAAVLLMALLLPPVRALATDFLGLFRIQRIEVVEVNPGDLPEHLGSAARFEQLLSNMVQVEPRGDASDAGSAADASTLAGFPVRLPTAGVPVERGERQIRVQQGARVTLTLDLPLLRALLSEMGHPEIALPDSLDGEQVIVDIPQAVTTAYGPCMDADANAGPAPSKPCVRLLQLPSPTVTAPPELDLNQMGAAFLQLMGMSEEEATRFSQQVDWSTTLVLPVPSSTIDYQAVQVDGVPGTLFEELDDTSGTRYMLLWVRDGIVYALTGFESADEALTLANSLE